MTDADVDPWNDDLRPMLERTLLHIEAWLASLPERPVNAPATVAEMVEAFNEPLPDGPTSAQDVVDLLARRAEPGLSAIGSGRFFGFVMGGSVPAALGADLLATAWDQNAGLRTVTPAAAVAEERAGSWAKELLALPQSAAVGFVTGGNMANFTGLAAARHRVLEQAGWDVEAKGLQGAPTVRVVVGDERHVTIDSSLRYLGLGKPTLVATDGQGRIDVVELEQVLDSTDGPTIVCLAAGNVNTGAFDDFVRAIPAAHAHDAWVHVDGAFGLWAATSPTTSSLTRGVGEADSWATDAHKWLNVPYDSGLSVVAHPSSVQAAFSAKAPYLLTDDVTPDPMDLVPEFSRRARGFAVWAALRSLGRDGVQALGDRLCSGAAQFATQLAQTPGCAVVNDVVLNQVLVRFDDDDHVTRAVVEAVIGSGVAYVGPTMFKGQGCMRISVCNGWTSPTDVERALDQINRSLTAVRGDT
jgi:glutamate/tyrosine decarboxylase-like PLP-dependent enzyme